MTNMTFPSSEGGMAFSVTNAGSIANLHRAEMKLDFYLTPFTVSILGGL